MDRMEQLDKMEALDHFDRDRLRNLAAALPVRHLEAGDSVYAQGDSSRDPHLILDGKVRFHCSKLGSSVNLWAAQTGEVFGESGFLAGTPPVVGATIDEDADLMVFVRSTLFQQIESDKELERSLCWTFWRSISHKLRVANQRLSEIFATSQVAATRARHHRAQPRDRYRVDKEAKQKLFEKQKLSDDEVAFLTTLSREERYAPDELIFREGDPGDKIYAILEGEVAIKRSMPGVGDEALAFLQRGDYFGEMALVDDLNRSADAIARSGGATVLGLSRSVIESVLDGDLSPSLRLLKLLCSVTARHLAGTVDKIATWEALARG